MTRIIRSIRRLRYFALAMILLVLGNRTTEAALISFDDLRNLPPRTSSSSFADANGGSSTLNGVTFPNSFAISGDLNVTSTGAGPFLLPRSGNYAGFGFENTTISTSLILQSLYLGSTSLESTGDGVTGLTIQALGSSNQILDSIAVTGLAVTPMFVDTSAFAALTGITGYRFRIDASGAGNPRFAVDDLQFSVVPEPSTVVLLGIGGLTLICLGRRKTLNA